MTVLHLPSRPFAALALAAALAACCASLPARAGGDDEHQALSATVKLSSTDGLQRLPLPLTVLQHAQRPDLSDVRVLDADNHPVPQSWAGEPVTATTSRWVNMSVFTWPNEAGGEALAFGSVQLNFDAAGAVLRIDRNDGQRTESRPPRGTAAASAAAEDADAATTWLLDLHDWALMPRTLRLHWSSPAEGIRRQVRVERSDDAQHWEPAGDATLLDAPGKAGRAIVRRDVRLSDNSSAAPRYLRIHVDQPLKLVRIEAEAVEAPRGAPLEQARLTPTLEHDAKDGQAIWLLDLGGPLPLRQMQIHLPEGNRVLPLEVSWRQSPKDPWRFAMQHTAFNLLRDGKPVVSSPFDVHAPPARYWRIAASKSVDSAAGTAGMESATQMEVSVLWQAPQLVFASSARQPLTLLAGAPKPRANNLSLFTLIPNYRAGAEYQLPQAELGDISERKVAVPTWTQDVREATPQEHKRWLLWAVLAAAVVALGVMARKLVLDMKAAPDA